MRRLSATQLKLWATTYNFTHDKRMTDMQRDDPPVGLRASAALRMRSLALHACAVALVAAVCALAMRRDAPDTTRYMAEARSLRDTGTFSLENEVPTLRDAPGFPFVLSVFMRIGFEKPETPARLLNAVCAGLIGFCCGLVVSWLLGDRWGGGIFPLLAVYYCGLFPTILGSCVFVLTEVVYAMLFLVGNVLVLRAWSTPSGKWLCLPLAGLALGLATLFRSVPYAYPLLAFPLLLFLSWKSGESVGALARRAGGPVLLGLAVFCAATLPWTLRNMTHSGAFVPVCFGTGTYLYIGASEEWNAQWPEFDPAERLMAERPEMTRIEADQELGRLAREKILGAPVSWLALALVKLKLFWFEVPGSKKQIGSPLMAYALMLVNMVNLSLAVVGGVALWRLARRRELLLILLPVVYTCALHVVLYAMGRFRVPVDPYLCVLAVVGGWVLCGKVVGLVKGKFGV